MTFSAGTYFAFPIWTLHDTFVVFNGVGILNITLLALSFGSKFALRWTVYSTLDLVGSTTWVWSLKGRLMFVVERYLETIEKIRVSQFEPMLFTRQNVGTYFINSNSPSGGMKLIDRSESNLPNRTHWWNWQSSNSTAPSTFDLSALNSEQRLINKQAICSLPSPSVNLIALDSLFLQDDFIVQSEFTFRRPTQVCSHLNRTIHIRSKNRSCRYPIPKRKKTRWILGNLTDTFENKTNLLYSSTCWQSRSHPQTLRSFDISHLLFSMKWLL